MKMKNIFKALSMAAVALFATSCADTDAQYSIPDVDAPLLVSSSPAAGAVLNDPSDITVTLTYDKNIGFPSQRYGEILATGCTVESAYVLGTDSVLTINISGLSRGTTVSLTIPEGLVVGPNKVGAPATTITFTVADYAEIAASPVAATSANAVALYEYLKNNYRQNILSGMMANVAWNYDESEKVYQITGKYPAINGFDYIHLAASYKGVNWIDYGDITPVQEWDAAGGIVTAGWHWLVPTKEVTVSSDSGGSDTGGETGDANAVWEGSLNVGIDWSTSGTVSADKFSGVSAGDVMTIYFTENSDAEYWQIKLMDGNWTTLTSYAAVDNGWGCIPLDAGATSYSITLNASDVSLIQSSGMILSGYGITYSNITVASASAGAKRRAPRRTAYSDLNVNSDLSYSPGVFDLKDAVTPGTWEYDVVQQDLKRISEYLLLLQQEDIPVLWRPLHEASGGWFWWGTDATAYKQLWQMMFNYFQAAGLNNLIWVWTSQEGTDTDWYPGDAYVDIIGCDIYGNGVDDCKKYFKAAQENFSGKMVTLSECGYSSYTSSTIADIPTQWEAGVTWSWFMPWYDGDGVMHADEAWWNAAMEKSYVITRDKVNYK